MPFDANAYQVGGSHYKSPYEHWDFVVDLNLDYLSASAIKYLARCGKKEGATLSDLEKALHYTVKMQEKSEILRTLLLATRFSSPYVHERTARFLDANAIVDVDARFAVKFLADAHWMSVGIEPVQRAIDRLIASRAPRPVPLEDSNKHADRSET